ncbi:hypothetical protein [Streptomyces sp. NPDC004324]
MTAIPGARHGGRAGTAGTAGASGAVRPGGTAPLTVSRAGERVHVVHTGSRPAGWLGELAGRLVPARPNETVVVVGAPSLGGGAEGLCRSLASVLDDCREGPVRLLVLVMSAGALGEGEQPSPAQLISERWGLDVLAAAGPAFVTSDGCLFSSGPPGASGASGGWWHFSRSADPRRVGSYLPVPRWAAAVRRVGRQTVAGQVVEPVPAGLAVRPAGPAPVAAHTRPHAVVPERDRPQLILASPDVPVAALAVVTASLPEPVRRVLRLVSLDGRSLLRTGQALADLSGGGVSVAVGSPATIEETVPDGALACGAAAESHMVDAVGGSWRPLAQTVLCPPHEDGRGGRAYVTEWRAPGAAGRGTGPAELALGGHWTAVVTPAGLWIGPSGGEPPLVAMGRHPSPEGIQVDIAMPREAVDDSLWPGLDRLFGDLEPEVRERAVLHVEGTPDRRFRERLHQVAVRHGLRPADPRIHVQRDTRQRRLHA